MPNPVQKFFTVIVGSAIGTWSFAGCHAAELAATAAGVESGRSSLFLHEIWFSCIRSISGSPD
jgi:hypothetical protein